MKLVREHINERFEEESDPIQDMGIGWVICPACNGKKSYPMHDPRSVDPETGEHDCRYCPIEVECEDCEGKGYVTKETHDKLMPIT